jgi:hypothetical protein
MATIHLRPIGLDKRGMQQPQDFFAAFDGVAGLVME